MNVGYDDILRVWREADTDPGDRARVAVRPPHADRRRPGRPDLRGLDAAFGAGRADRAAAARPDGHQQPLPPAGGAGEDRDHRGRRLRRTARLRHRRGLPPEPSPGPARVRRPRPAVPRRRTTPSAALAEACTVIRRLWTEDAPFDFDGEHVQLKGAFGNPKPVQRPHPPIMIGGRASATLRVVAEHADLWNIPGGGDIDDLVGRSALLDRYCAEIGRDPASITRSIFLAGGLRQARRHAREDRRGRRRRASGTSCSAWATRTRTASSRWVADELIR